MRVTSVSPQRLRRVEEITEAVVHTTRAALRPGLEFLESHGKTVGHTLDLTETLSGTDRGIVGGLGLANLVLGVTELSQSYQSLCQNDQTRGYLNAASGSASIVGGLSLGFAAATGCPTLGPLAVGNLGAASMGVAAMADGAEDVVLARRDGGNKLAMGLGALKVTSGAICLAGAMSASPGMQAVGSLVFLGAAAGQHLRAAVQR